MSKELIVGMKRALNACQNCDGDLDYAIFIITRDIEVLESIAAASPAPEKEGK